MLGYILLGIGAVIVVAILFPAVRRPNITSSRSKQNLKVRDTSPVPVGDSVKTCPVCRCTLESGERIKSVVYRDGVRHGEITEYTTHIFGCPHCYPANRRHPRICPVCRGEVNRDGHLIARMFERKGRKKHVRVLGCTACRDNRRRSEYKSSSVG